MHTRVPFHQPELVGEVKWTIYSLTAILKLHAITHGLLKTCSSGIWPELLLARLESAY